MKRWFEELDCRQTPMGELVLQRRSIAALNHKEVYEVKLGAEYLMSSLFYEAETALADECLGLLGGVDRTVVVGGLGLGYTAAAALKYKSVRQLIVVEALQPVIDWHREGLVPNGAMLTADPRCVYRCADFFALARGKGFDPDIAGRCFDAVLLDIDHTPSSLLSPSHADFYTVAGLRNLKQFLNPGGVFGLWSNEPPDEKFLEIMAAVFEHVEGHLIRFDNPLRAESDSTSVNGIYIAR